LDLLSLAENLHFQKKAGIKTVCVLGGTGEAASLTEKERHIIMEETMRECKEMQVVFGVLAGRPQEVMTDIQKAKELGAVACLVMAPPFVRPSESDVERLMEDYASLGMPLILFNTPSRSGFSMSAGLISRLSKREEVIGIKESSGDMVLLQNIRIACPLPFGLLTGGDNLYLPSIVLGGDGGILASAAVIPEVCLALDAAISAGELKKAKRLHYAVKLLDDVLYKASHPVPLKIAMQHRKLPAGGCRPPFETVEYEHMLQVISAMTEIKNLVSDLVDFVAEYPL
jgi:4-hydroxy-tetrahydrodipicolinate synthase